VFLESRSGVEPLLPIGVGARGRCSGGHRGSAGAVGTSYPFKAREILNLDASDVVIADDSPAGAHSDIFHPQLAWVVAAAGDLKTA